MTEDGKHDPMFALMKKLHDVGFPTEQQLAGIQMNVSAGPLVSAEEATAFVERERARLRQERTSP